MSTILVTGATGSLGRPTVAALRTAGHTVRPMSRTSREGGVVADLTTGAGLQAALDGVDTVVHLATAVSKADIAHARTLVTAARAAGVRHLVYVSIVGVDRIPFPYYRAKFECERVIEESGIPFTILRATQFHGFVAKILSAPGRLPFLVSLPIDDQPIAVEEVAQRLAELAADAPAGRVDDIGGPEVLSFDELAAQWQRAHGTRKTVWRFTVPGRTMAAFRAGHHLAGLPGYGRETFAQFSQRHARGTNEA